MYNLVIIQTVHKYEHNCKWHSKLQMARSWISWELWWHFYHLICFPCNALIRVDLLWEKYNSNESAAKGSKTILPSSFFHLSVLVWKMKLLGKIIPKMFCTFLAKEFWLVYMNSDNLEISCYFSLWNKLSTNLSDLISY